MLSDVPTLHRESTRGSPSFSASSTMRLAIRSLIDPPEEKNSVLPSTRRTWVQFENECGVDEAGNSHRLHFRPWSLAILSKRTKGVAPTPSRTVSNMGFRSQGFVDMCVSGLEGARGMRMTGWVSTLR